jgi:hypothetical protein
MGWDGPLCDIVVRVLDEVALHVTGESSQVLQTPAMGTFTTLTVEWWMLPEYLEGTQMILQPMETIIGGLGLGMKDNQLMVELEQAKTLVFWRKFRERIWSHVSLTFDTKLHLVTLFLDGYKIDQATIPATQISIVSSRLGGLVTSDRSCFRGYLKEFRVWSVVRTATQVATRTFTALTGSEDHLETLYPLDGPLSANTVYLNDLAGNHGTRITGAVWERAPSTPPGPRSVPPVLETAPIPEGV